MLFVNVFTAYIVPFSSTRPITYSVILFGDNIGLARSEDPEIKGITVGYEEEDLTEFNSSGEKIRIIINNKDNLEFLMINLLPTPQKFEKHL